MPNLAAATLAAVAAASTAGEAGYTGAVVSAEEDFMAAVAGFAARVDTAAADSEVVTVSAALVAEGIGTGLAGRAERRRADSAEVEAGVPEAARDRRLVGAEEARAVDRIRH